MVTREEAAEALNNSEYGDEGSMELFAQMKEAGLVAVFGASDDLMEFRGAIYGEVGCYGGGIAYVDYAGLLTPLCNNSDCPHENTRRSNATTIEANWDDGHGFAWTTPRRYHTPSSSLRKATNCIAKASSLICRTCQHDPAPHRPPHSRADAPVSQQGRHARAAQSSRMVDAG